MASHVVIIDTTARSVKIRTAPDKHLMEVLEEACARLGRDPSKFGLKHNNKNVDLSRTIRLAGLSSGAKLELVVSSRSPSVVSLALQLPQAEKDGTTRLTEKFPSNTTLWMVLRNFESARGAGRNFTGRGVPIVGGETTGSGRLYFETPVIQVMGREFVSFTDLQKTLSQLGFNSGSVLLRLSFRKTETPLEDAMIQIGQYFKEVEEQESITTAATESRKGDIQNSDGQISSDQQDQSLSSPDGVVPPIANQDNHPANPSKIPMQEPQTLTGPSQRPIAVFAPPTSSTPKAAQQAFNEKDYEPTVDHAKLHQQRLKASGQNQRLPTDAELAAQAEAQAQRNTQIKEVKIKVRFPDQLQVEAPFTNTDTASTLYKHVTDLMQNPQEPFSLTFSTSKGPKHVPQESNAKLISDLGMVGRVLVNFVWDAGATASSRKSPTLKAEFRQNAQEIQVKEIEGVDIVEEASKQTPKTPEKGKERKGGVPKWLKLPGKK